jgi:acyl-CoA thioester hydrolase
MRGKTGYSVSAMSRFSHSITVPESAIDVLGHVNNIEYLRWVQDVAVAHSEHCGLAWDDYRALGAAFIIRRHAIEYLRSARAGDVLAIATWIDSLTRISAERGTEITNAAGEVVARAMTTWVWISLATHRPQRIPPVVRQRFGVDA